MEKVVEVGLIRSISVVEKAAGGSRSPLG